MEIYFIILAVLIFVVLRWVWRINISTRKTERLIHAIALMQFKKTNGKGEPYTWEEAVEEVERLHAFNHFNQ
jgi:hypothetical protein